MRTERECSVDELVPVLREGVKDLLPGGEQVLMCYETHFQESRRVSLFTRSDLNVYYASVVTPIRLISAIVNNNYLSKAISRLLVDIHTIREEKHDVYGFIVEGSEEIYFPFTPKDAYDKFLSLLRNAVNESHKKDIASQIGDIPVPKSPEERLRALSQLHKDGLVTDIEFEQKRKQILTEL